MSRAGGGGEGSVGRCYALIVEDDTALQDLLALVLRDEGCAVDVAASGADALRLARTRRPDAILLDYLLPDMSGAEFARRWRAHERTQERTHERAHERTQTRSGADGTARAPGRGIGGGVPIVLVTAEYRPERAAADVEADALVAKPFELGDLLAALRPYLDCLAAN